MRTIAQAIRFVLWAFAAVMFISTTLAASDDVIRGTVTDAAGKPIRGALVKAKAGGKSITRFSQKDGRYEITLPAGNYDVYAEAYGFGPKRQPKDTSQAGETNFTLSPRWDVTRLSGAELESLLPDNAETRRIRGSCVGCHSIGMMLLKRGSTASEWQFFLPQMVRNRMFNLTWSPAGLAAMSEALGKYFGPDSPYFGPDAEPPAPERVKHAELSDAALRATIREYQIPTGAGVMAHSIAVDSKGYAWFSEYDYQSNKIGRFDIEKETFQEYTIPTPRSAPHTGVVGKDGRFWIALAGANVPKLASLDPTTGQIKEYQWPEKKPPTHSLALDAAGNLWFSGGGNDELWSFDVKKEQFQAHKFPVPPNYPEDSLGTWEKVPGEPPAPVEARSYDVRVDSKGTVWFTQMSLGTLVSLDPVTGKTKEYKPPGNPSMRGLAIDAHDNIWFANFHGHKVGKLDAKTGTIKQYQPPTANATPYGFVIDEKAGYVWYADMSGNNITRFDPKTEQFVEYPIPTRNANSRFIGLDSKGRVWFTEFVNGKIGVVDPGEGSRQVASAR